MIYRFIYQKYIENGGVEKANIVSRMLKAREEMVEEKKKEIKKKQLKESYQKDGCPEARNKVNVQEEAFGIAKIATRMDVQKKIKDEKGVEKTLPEGWKSSSKKIWKKNCHEAQVHQMGAGELFVLLP